jgi:hypothetical protein
MHSIDETSFRVVRIIDYIVYGEKNCLDLRKSRKTASFAIERLDN